VSAGHEAGCLIERARRYACLDARPLISRRTRFFAAAELVTRALVHLPSQFLLGLSERLERKNLARARQIERGCLYTQADVSGNTREFVHYEQALVQQELEFLRREGRVRYLRELTVVNTALALLSQGRAPRGCDAALITAVQTARGRCAETLDFASQRHREELGWAIARSVMESRGGNVASVPARP
jgi:hypothetical protein